MNKKNLIARVVVFALIFTLIFSTLAGLTPPAISSQGAVSDTFTHTIFAEFGTATWCGYCKYASAALKNIYESGNYPFYYITLVKDKNVHAAERLLDDYNHFAYPTVYFDGGFRVDIGSGSIPSAEAKYIESIDSCGNRPVVEIDVTMQACWLGDATMYIKVLVQNNDTSNYQGYLRVYVNEISSSMGWDDTWGNPYAFTFLDFAIERNVFVGAGGIWKDSTFWNGNEYTDGYHNDFGSITFGNISLIAAVFNPEWHQGDAYPDIGFPFDAYYVDEAAQAIWLNSPPNVPSEPMPEDEATYVDAYTNLIWSGGDPDEDDTITYDVYLGASTSPPLVVSGYSGTSYAPESLSLNTTYYWKIISWDNHDTSRVGPEWSFTTAVCGDLNGDGEINLSDPVCLANYYFGKPCEIIPSVSEVDCDGSINLSDAMRIAKYYFGIPEFELNCCLLSSTN